MVSSFSRLFWWCSHLLSTDARQGAHEISNIAIYTTHNGMTYHQMKDHVKEEEEEKRQ